MEGYRKTNRLADSTHDKMWVSAEPWRNSGAWVDQSDSNRVRIFGCGGGGCGGGGCGGGGGGGSGGGGVHDVP